MKVAKTVSVDLELLLKVLRVESNFSKAVSDALTLWLERTSSEKLKK